MNFFNFKNASNNIVKSLCCPNCNSDLEYSNDNFKCIKCFSKYVINSFEQLDLRLNKEKYIKLDFVLKNKIDVSNSIDFTKLEENKYPEIDFRGISIPWHLTKELVSYFPKAKTNSSLMLDLGCGRVIHKEICEFSGFEYVGVDFNSENAPILGDAQALPFRDNTFEFILSIAVLEHIQYPLLMMNEIKRVLKPNGIIIGTVAFLEPYHSNSFYHHTHLGLYNSLAYSGLKINKISPSKDWNVITAQAYMMLFPKLNWKIIKKIIYPFQKLHEMWYKINKLNENERILFTTGAFSFIAKREK